MIIDPDRDGCTIWEGNKVQHLKGTPEECVYSIIKKLDERYGLIKPSKKYELINIQEAKDIDFNIALDVMGIGRYYKDIFEHHGIKIHEIRPGKII
jgi:hypothetical protein